MPLYDYACSKCGHTLEVRHGFNESYDKPCALCGAPVRRVFNAAPVLFKGSGFYVTDSRRGSGGTKVEKLKARKAERISAPLPRPTQRQPRKERPKKPSRTRPSRPLRPCRRANARANSGKLTSS